MVFTGLMISLSPTGLYLAQLDAVDDDTHCRIVAINDREAFRFSARSAMEAFIDDTIEYTHHDVHPFCKNNERILKSVYRGRSLNWIQEQPLPQWLCPELHDYYNQIDEHDIIVMYTLMSLFHLCFSELQPQHA